MNNKRSRIEWKGILELLRESGKSKTAFCKENNISLSTLQYHLLKRKKKNKSNNLVKVPFSIENPIGRSKETTLQIKTDYCTIKFLGNIKEEELKGLLRALKTVSI